MLRSMMVLPGLSVMTASQADEWQRRSPDGAVAFDVSRAGSRLLLGALDGLYASSDDASNWTRIDSIPPSQAAHRIAVDPHDVNHWYILVSETYLDPANPFPVQVRSVERETRDGGLSWQSPTFHMRPYYGGLPVFHPAANRVIARWWPTTSPGYGWQYSANGGLNWNAHSGFVYRAAIGLPLPGHPFAALAVSDQDFTTMEFRLGSADGSSFGAPVASLNISGA